MAIPGITPNSRAKLLNKTMLSIAGLGKILLVVLRIILVLRGNPTKKTARISANIHPAVFFLGGATF